MNADAPTPDSDKIQADYFNSSNHADARWNDVFPRIQKIEIENAKEDRF